MFNFMSFLHLMNCSVLFCISIILQIIWSVRLNNYCKLIPIIGWFDVDGSKNTNVYVSGFVQIQYYKFILYVKTSF